MFEDLPNELVLLVFSYLQLSELVQSFSSLNTRFEQLIFNNFTPLYVRLTPDFSLPIDKFCFRINNLCLINWNPYDVLSFFHQSDLPQLKCLKIQSSDNLYFGRPVNDLIHQIYSLSNLSKCQIKLAPTIFIQNFHLQISTSIRHLKLSMITLDMLFHLLIHVPNLHLLNVWLNSNGRRFDSTTYDQDYRCLKLKTFIIGLHSDIIFEEVSFLLRRMPELNSFQIFGSVWDRHFLSANIWENILLGQNLFPMLNKIRINLSVRYPRNRPNIHSVTTEFRRHIFRQTNFSVACDQLLWFHIHCLWKN